MKIKLSDYVLNFIAEQGVQHVFTLVGGGAMHLDDSLGQCRNIKYVCNLHEQACAISAEAYARISGLGVGLVTTGPGGTNAITGVVGAWQDSTPCLFISGQVKRSDLMKDKGVRQMGMQEVDIVTLVSSVTKYAVTIMDPFSIRYHLEKAVYTAKAGRPGPVWIDIPLDVQAVNIDPNELESFKEKNEDIPKDDDQLNDLIIKVIDFFNAAERPVILAGNGVRLSGAKNYFYTLIDALNVPVLLTWPAMDILPDNYPLLIGRPGSIAPRGANFTLQNADLILMIGTRLDFALTGYAPEKFGRGAKKIMVDIDPCELDKLKNYIDLPICMDVKIFLNGFCERIDSYKRKNIFEWHNRCQQWKKIYPVVLPEHRQSNDKVSIYYLTEILSEELQSDDLVVPGSSGFGVEIFLLAFKVKKGQRVFNTTALGAMGFGIPAAIGACLASGKKRTICVDGDGGFQLNIQELETLHRLHLPIKFFVLNNNGYASIRAMQNRYFGKRMGSDADSGMTLPDLVKVATAYNLTACRINDQVDLRAQVKRVLEMPGPVICDVLMRPDEPRAPSLSSAQNKNGLMVSKPLEDLWPFLEREEFFANMIIPPLKEDL
jgi:acetolactate synthase-1/2/3 large subunit